jgi:peroxiredoxin Q/BCP
MKKGILFMALFNLFSLGLNADVQVGGPAPKLTGITETGETADLSKYSKGYVLVYFYPKADTPGCTAQACSLRDAYTQLQKDGVTIFGVSSDNVESQLAFKKKHRLPFTLIADTKKEWAKAFGVPIVLGFMKRQAFLIEDGKIVWLDRSAATDKQAQDIMKVISERTVAKK